METTTFDGIARSLSSTRSRRSTLRGLVAGALTAVAGGAVLPSEEASAKRRKKKSKKQKGDTSAPPPPSSPPPPPPSPPPPPPNPCAGKNWCLDRSQTCGPAGGYGKCLVEMFGGNICAELLFQVATCTECDAPNCVNCRCVLAAGGGDKCNNGANGYDYICVRDV